MDVKISYPLVVLPPPEQGTLVPVSAAIEIDFDSGRKEPDALALLMFLWRRFRKLAFLFLLALDLVRRLKRLSSYTSRKT